MFSGLKEEHTSWATIVQNASQKNAKPPESSIITAQLLDKAWILSIFLVGIDKSIALFGKSGKQKFSPGISSNAGPSTKQSIPRGKLISKNARYDKTTA